MPHKHFDERLADLEQRLLSMSHKVEGLVEKSVAMAMGSTISVSDRVVSGISEMIRSSNRISSPGSRGGMC